MHFYFAKYKLDAAPGTKIHLKNFLNNLSDLKDSIGRRIIRERMDFTLNFYNDNDFAKIKIEEREKRLKNNILLVYRYRNKIVHNAHYDNKILPYYVHIARKCSKASLAYILDQYAVQNVEDIEAILMDKYNKFEKLKRNLEKDKQIKLLNISM